MRSKKPSTAKQPSPEQTAVERHVESLMNPGAVGNVAGKSEAAPLDIFKDQKTQSSISIPVTTTAPELPGKASKKVAPSPVPDTNDALSRIKVVRKSPSAASTEPENQVPVAVIPTSNTASPVDSELASDASNIAATTKPMAAAETVSITSAAVNVENLARKEAYNDSATDSAVAEILASEGDDLLAAEDAVKLQLRNPVVKKSGRYARLRKFFTSKWLLLIIPIILIILAGVPFTRYKLAGLVVKQSLTVTVTDSVNSKPVSGAVVSFKGVTTKTSSSGEASFRVPLGTGQLTITKQYYKNYSLKDTVGFTAPAQPLKVNLLATGRQVPLTIINKLTGKVLADATVKVLGTSAVSDAQGQVTIVLPAKSLTAAATISASGYNTLSTTVQVTDLVVTANSFSLTPAGDVYFLSNASGKLDVVKTNLDGSNRQVVFAGTGQEDPANTTLTASRDWRFVVLKSRRDGSQTGLYLIDTSTDKVTQFDTGDGAYTAIGWSGHTFVYDLVHSSEAQSETGREALKAYNADQLQLNLLDQTQADGSSSSYGYQAFNSFYLVDTQLVYNTQWSAYTAGGDSYDLTGKSDSIRTVTVGGQNKKDLQTYDATGTAYTQAVRPEPYSIYYAVYDSTDSTVTYYDYENGAVSNSTTLTSDAFSKTYPTFLASPDATKSFWNELRDGKQTLLVGDKNGASSSAITSTGEYSAYGWYGSQYLLLSLQKSGLYIVPAASSVASQPLKISDYYQAPTADSTYGGGF
jgi:hypothetical protein